MSQEGGAPLELNGRHGEIVERFEGGIPVSQNVARMGAYDEGLDGAMASLAIDAEETGGDVRQERVVVKFLVPNVAAGSIIGKSGSNITEIQTQSGARMQLSRSNEFYPGTLSSQDRILLVSGTVDQLLTALHLVLTKLKSEPAAVRAIQSKDADRLQLRMLVHNRLCGTLIGKGGATIRSFNEDSSATFNISPPPSLPGLTERVVKVTGEVDELMRAVALIVTKLSENPDFHLLTDANLVYSVRGYNNNGNSSSHHHHHHQQQQQGYPFHHMSMPLDTDGPTTTVTLAIPEERVGNVIGKQGSVISQIKELVSVTVRISKKGEHLPGTHDRACHITGTPESVEIAQRLIMQRIEGRH